MNIEQGHYTCCGQKMQEGFDECAKDASRGGESHPIRRRAIHWGGGGVLMEEFLLVARNITQAQHMAAVLSHGGLRAGVLRLSLIHIL